MALNANPGDAAANSYTTVAYADAYFAERLHAEVWLGLSETSKEAALIWATRDLEPQPWRGAIATQGQRLRHPRINFFDADGRLLPDDEVAEAVQNATCEYAMTLAGSDETVNTGLEGFDGLKVDVIDLKVNQEFLDKKRASLPDNVQRILNGYLIGTTFGISQTRQTLSVVRT